jgi:hypothetical protein
VVVLATSREGLALDGEQLLALPSLGIPDGHADSPRSAAPMPWTCSCSEPVRSTAISS